MLAGRNEPINRIGFDRRTPLTRAVHLDDIDAISQLILNDKADIDQIDGDKLSPLAWAVKLGHLDKVGFLLKNKAKISSDIIFLAFNRALEKKTSEMNLSHKEILNHLLVIQSYIIDSSIDPATQNSFFHWGIILFKQAPEIFNNLLKNKIVLKQVFYAKNAAGNTLLHLAVEAESLELVKLLISEEQNLFNANKLANIVNAARETPYKAALERNSDIAQFLQSFITTAPNEDKQKQGIQLPEVNPHLMKAAGEGRLAIVKKFIDLNSLNAKDKTSSTPLHAAVIGNQLAVVKYLVEQKVDVNCADDLGETAINKAAANGNLEIVKCLLQANADLSLTSSKGHDALLAAVLPISTTIQDDKSPYGEKDKSKLQATEVYKTNMGRIGVIQYLLKNHMGKEEFKTENKQKLFINTIENHKKVTALHYILAIEQYHPGLLSSFLNVDDPIGIKLALHIPYQNGDTILHQAVKLTTNEEVKLLFNKDNALASVKTPIKTTLLTLKNEENQTPHDLLLKLIRTADKAKNRSEMLRLTQILQEFHKLTIDNAPQMFRDAVERGDLIEVKRLFKVELLDLSDALLNTPLHVAVKGGAKNTEVLKFLIDSGANALALTQDGDLPLEMALELRNNDAAIRILKTAMRGNSESFVEIKGWILAILINSRILPSRITKLKNCQNPKQMDNVIKEFPVYRSNNAILEVNQIHEIWQAFSLGTIKEYKLEEVLPVQVEQENLNSSAAISVALKISPAPVRVESVKLEKTVALQLRPRVAQDEPVELQQLPPPPANAKEHEPIAPVAQPVATVVPIPVLKRKTSLPNLHSLYKKQNSDQMPRRYSFSK